MGRPLKFRSKAELQRKIDEYFDKTPKKEVTITGLALHLDTTRETLMDYERKDGYSDTIKRAKNRVALEYEKDLREKGGAGNIFALKNFNWTDKQEINANISQNISFLGLFKEADKIKQAEATVVDIDKDIKMLSSSKNEDTEELNIG